nr:PREDICTED: neurofilament heavy polypeptide-like [Anolis carolinensis]XP_016853760.1 PREDICTED: neurofilament heavy polypeptide-like [Anolis carolinensis]XP_016853761.1 PREDICTED: neurofilament heavy polypeptide-like [Anolis carolinensis]XP_016853762.1 PREDICTED: neurofilament heavy polypeptide-like [Anolis carolinensis]|eukprot:XP_008121012.1 PREDICTED: neurofilament heavy polypeptide-like [Anolis carolinensis]
MESQALQMSRSLALNLQGTYENLLANLQDLPAHLQKKLYQTCQRMGELGSDFNSAQSFGDLSRNVLKKSFEVMAEAQGSLDELMEYALQSPQALLWLKDRLPVLEARTGEVQALCEDSLLPNEGEEFPPNMEMRNILQIQQTYDPTGCEDDTLSSKEEVAPPSHSQDLEDILETLHAYDPKGCEDDIPPKKENEEVQPSSKVEWNILETLQGYIPRLPDKGDVPSDEKEETPPSTNEVEEERETDILKLQQAHDPKCYEDGAPSGEEVQVATSPSQTEWKDIIEIQQDYDPKGCVEAPRLSTSEEASSGQLGDWNILTTLQSLQAYVPKISSEKAPPAEEKNEVVEEKEVEEEEEDLERDILKTQKAHDPKCYEDGMPSGEEVEVATSPSQTEWKDIIEIQQDYDPKGCVEAPRLSTSEAASSGQLGDWNILTTLQSLQAYVPKISSEKAPPAEEKNEVLEQKEEGKEEKEEDLERDILKTQKAHDPKCYEDGMPSGEEVEVATSPSQTEWKDIIEIQQDYDPKGCVEAPRVSTSEVASSGQLGDWNILTTLQSLQAYVPKICPEKAPPAEGKKEMVEEKEVEKEEDLERDILETQKAHDSKGCKEEVAVQTSSRWESTNILQMQAMYEPRDCKEGAPLSEEVVVPSSGKQDSEDILKILQAYDPRACDEEPPPRKEGETPPSNQEEWNVLKMLQAYVPKSCPFEVPSFKEKTPEVEPSKKQVVKEKSILKNHLANNSGVSSERIEMGNILKMAMYSPKDCEEGAPSRKEGEEAVRPSGKAKTEDILKIQRAYDPMGCEDEAPSWKERRESQTSGKQEEWNIMKFFQSYIPKSRSEEPSAATIVEVKAEGAAASPTSKQDVKPVPPAPSKREVKEAMTPARKWDIQEWDILKIQEAYDPQGCKEDDR